MSLKGFAPPILPLARLRKMIDELEIDLGGPYVNVLDFGVKGDGTTDDGPAITKLCLDFRGTGIILYFPKRTYRIATTIAPVSDVTWALASGATFDGVIPGATTADVIVFYNFGPLATGATTVAAPNVLFSKDIKLASVAGIVGADAVGDDDATWVAPFPAALGIRGGIFRVEHVDVPTATVTVDRPVLWPFAALDGVSIYNGVGPDGHSKCPAIRNFNIIAFGDALSEGCGGIFTGQCVAYTNLVGAMGCRFQNLRGQPGGSGTGLASDAGFAFQIGYLNEQIGLAIDGRLHNCPNKGVPLVAQEKFYSERVVVNGCDQTNWGVQDCVDCDFVDSVSQGGAMHGVVLATETVAVSGIQANRWVRFRGLSIVDCAAEALALGVGDSFNSFDGVFIARAQVVGINVNDGGAATPVQENSFSNVDVHDCQIGVRLQNHAIENHFVNLSVDDSLAQDVLVDAGASGTSFQSLVVNNSVGAGAHVEIHDDTTIDGMKGVFTVASSIAVEVAAGRVSVRGYFFTLPANSDAFYVPAGVLSVSDGKAGGSNAGTTGVQTNGGTARLGQNNDFSALGASILNSAGFFNRGSFTLPPPGPIPFPDLKTTDNVKITLAALGGAGTGLSPVIVQTPTVGFTAAGPGGDTSTWIYEIS